MLGGTSGISCFLNKVQEHMSAYHKKFKENDIEIFRINIDIEKEEVFTR